MRWLFWLLAWPAWAAPAEDLTARLQALESLQASFTQLARDAAGRQVQEIDGRLVLSRPNLMRWETGDPIPQVVVSDGDTLYTYDVDLEQVTLEPASILNDSPAGLLLELGEASLTERFTVTETRGSEGQVLYQLTPREDELYQLIVLEFLGEQPLSIGVVDSLDQQTRVQLREVRLNQILEGKPFSFTAPDGVDMFDNRL